MCSSLYYNNTATTEIYTLSLHDALPIFELGGEGDERLHHHVDVLQRLARPLDLLLQRLRRLRRGRAVEELEARSEEHTSELQSLAYLVCRLLLENKKSHSWLRLCRATPV